VQYAMRMYSGTRGRTAKTKQYFGLCDKFRSAFGREAGLNDRHFPVHFLGLWDTVSSVGWVWNPANYPFTFGNTSVHNVRHAISIDEHRASFRQNRFNIQDKKPEQDWVEYWFPGCHADVAGGSGPGKGHLGIVPFDWIIREARSKELLVDDVLLQQARTDQGPLPPDLWNEPINESLTGIWNLAEFFPKLHYDDETQKFEYRANLYRRRTIKKGYMIHESALRRVKYGTYRPENFSAEFIEKVKGLTTIPEALPYG